MALKFLNSVAILKLAYLAGIPAKKVSWIFQWKATIREQLSYHRI